MVESYPSDSVGFLRDEKDRFRNPVGHTLRREIRVLYGALVDGLEPGLKDVVQNELQDKLGSNQFNGELREFESRVDGLALEAFDCFMDCRETIYRIKAGEADRRSAKLLERINEVYGEKDRPGGNRTESR